MMRVQRIAPSYAAWREAARRLLAAGVEPDQVAWSDGGAGQAWLLDEAMPLPESREAARVPRAFPSLAESVACHSDPERWALLYSVLWRLTHGERHLLEVASDPAVARLATMEKAVRRDAHKMKAFVRFRGIQEPDGETRFVAWFEPAHRIVERTAPFFVDRFRGMRWSILTPDRSAHWDGETLAFAEGVPRSGAPAPDVLEELWRTYYASTFNPARVRPEAMRAEMPVRYWRDLPEARLIEPLMRDAPGRVRRMIEEQGERLARPGDGRRKASREGAKGAKTPGPG